MRNRSNLAVLVSLALVAGIAYWLALNPAVGEEEATPSPPATQTGTLWPLSASEITSFEITDMTTGDAIRLERIQTAVVEEPQWIMTEPSDSLADQVQAGAAVSGIANLIVSRVLTEIDGLAPYGVQSPLYTLIVTVEGSETPLVARIGTTNPGDSAYYVQRAGENYVSLVNKAGVDALIDLIATPPYQPTPTPNAPGPAAEPLDGS